MLLTLNNKNFNLPLFPWWFFIYVYTILLPLSLKNKPFISFPKRTTAPLPWDFGLIPGHPILCIAVLSCPISSHVTCYSLHLEYPPRNHVLKAPLPGPDTTVECETIGGDRILGRKSGKLTLDVPLKGIPGPWDSLLCSLCNSEVMRDVASRTCCLSIGEKQSGQVTRTETPETVSNKGISDISSVQCKVNIPHPVIPSHSTVSHSHLSFRPLML